MLFELRTYDLKPAKAPVYLDNFRRNGVGLVTASLPLGGYWMTESGRISGSTTILPIASAAAPTFPATRHG